MSEPAVPPHVELQSRWIHLSRLLGEGGMGQVFDGFAPDLGQCVAVKILRAEHAADDAMRARFQEEIALLGLIDHPGCTPIYGQGENEEGLPCYAMKKVEGRTLADLLAERGSAIHNTPWRRRLLAVLLDACDTLACVHELGVVHRDIKPDNILIDRHQSVYVIDWGVARRFGQVGEPKRTLAGQIIGSPGYMAPEQAEGRAGSAGPRADVFALGAILYEILTGQRPFGGTGGREEMNATVYRDPTPPEQSNRHLPRNISGICMKALHKDAAQRYPDARCLAADLRAFLEGRLSWQETVREAARRHPLRAVGGGLLAFMILALVVGTGAQFWTDQQMAVKAMKRVATLDAELVKIAAEADVAHRQFDAAKAESVERVAVQQELHRLDARWIVTEFEALRLLASVTELRFVKVESEIHPLARARLLNMVKSLIDRGQPALANGLIETVLARHRDGRDALGLRENEVAQLKRFAEEATRRLVANGK